MKTRGAILFLVCFGACSDTLDGVGNVHDLRMLAMRADPPDVLIVPNAGPVTVTALIANPPGALPVTCTWTTCAAPEGETSRCEPSSPGFAVLGSSTEMTGPLGAEPKVTFRPDPALLQTLRELDQFKGLLGLRQQVQLEIRAGNESVVGFKRVVYTVFTGAPVMLNRNPVVGPIEFNDAGWPEDAGVVFAIAAPRPPGPPVPTGDARNLMAVIEDRSLREDYVVRTFEGDTRTLTETWRYNFFASNGAFSPTQAGGANLLAADGGVIETRWARVDGEDGGSGPTTVWIVVRDGRGGESWAVRTATAP